MSKTLLKKHHFGPNFEKNPGLATPQPPCQGLRPQTPLHVSSNPLHVPAQPPHPPTPIFYEFMVHILCVEEQLKQQFRDLLLCTFVYFTIYFLHCTSWQFIPFSLWLVVCTMSTTTPDSNNKFGANSKPGTRYDEDAGFFLAANI